MHFMRSLPLNSLRAYFLALRINIFLKRESVNTKVEDDARARGEKKRETCLVMFSECDQHCGCSAP
jgi:hypothetical protein